MSAAERMRRREDLLWGDKFSLPGALSLRVSQHKWALWLTYFPDPVLQIRPIRRHQLTRIFLELPHLSWKSWPITANQSQSDWSWSQSRQQSPSVPKHSRTWRVTPQTIPSQFQCYTSHTHSPTCTECIITLWQVNWYAILSRAESSDQWGWPSNKN